MSKGPMPPWRQFRDLLPPEEHAALLDWTLANRERFQPSSVTGYGVDPSRRISDTLRDFGPTRAALNARLKGMLPEILKAAGTRPQAIEHIELELAAHGDGAFFHAHRDIPTGPDRRPLGGDSSGTQDRVVSAVYYFHREPKAFSGGELRLYRFGGEEDVAEDVIDIEPLDNSLVVFPSWALHEVRPVQCPSGRFEDRRFAINAWFCRTLRP